MTAQGFPRRDVLVSMWGYMIRTCICSGCIYEAREYGSKHLGYRKFKRQQRMARKRRRGYA